jgi:hypothetical protein
VAAITAFNIDQFAYMVKKMHALKEGDGTLLDNCIMMWGSGLEDGDKHTVATTSRSSSPAKAAAPSRPDGSCPTSKAIRATCSPRSSLRRHPAGSPDRHCDQTDHRNEGMTGTGHPRITRNTRIKNQISEELNPYHPSNPRNPWSSLPFSGRFPLRTFVASCETIGFGHPFLIRVLCV